MGTLFAGFLRIPITSIFMVIEVSGSYTAILPVMVSSLIAYLISHSYHQVSLFDMLSRQDGMSLPSIEERREHVSLVVEDAMRREGAIVVSPHDPVQKLVRNGASHQDQALLMCVRVGEWRILDPDDVKRLAADNETAHIAAEVNSKGPLPLIFPDEPLDEVLRWTGDWSVLPVVNRADLGELEGILTLADILLAFRRAAAD